MTKCCSKCQADLPLAEFSVDRQKRDGRRPSCKSCDTKNRPSQLIASRKWKQRNAEHVRWYKQWQYDAYLRQPRKPADPAARVRARRAWKQRNPEAIIADSARRRALEHRAIMAWANYFFVDEAYDLARKREAATGIEWHVDHIVPLRSAIVSGLHVEHNLQVIPARHNLSKGNRFTPCDPAPAAWSDFFG